MRSVCLDLAIPWQPPSNVFITKKYGGHSIACPDYNSKQYVSGCSTWFSVAQFNIFRQMIDNFMWPCFMQGRRFQEPLEMTLTIPSDFHLNWTISANSNNRIGDFLFQRVNTCKVHLYSIDNKCFQSEFMFCFFMAFYKRRIFKNVSKSRLG